MVVNGCGVIWQLLSTITTLDGFLSQLFFDLEGVYLDLGYLFHVLGPWGISGEKRSTQAGTIITGAIDLATPFSTASVIEV